MTTTKTDSSPYALLAGRIAREAHRQQAYAFKKALREMVRDAGVTEREAAQHLEAAGLIEPKPLNGK